VHFIIQKHIKPSPTFIQQNIEQLLSNYYGVRQKQKTTTENPCQGREYTAVSGDQQ
jgi:hypothetical protein